MKYPLCSIHSTLIDASGEAVAVAASQELAHEFVQRMSMLESRLAEDKTKIEFITCEEHDHEVVYINDEMVISNDYSNENLHRVADHLGWEIVKTELSRDEFETRFG